MSRVAFASCRSGKHARFRDHRVALRLPCSAKDMNANAGNTGSAVSPKSGDKLNKASHTNGAAKPIVPSEPFRRQSREPQSPRIPCARSPSPHSTQSPHMRAASTPSYDCKPRIPWSFAGLTSMGNAAEHLQNVGVKGPQVVDAARCCSPARNYGRVVVSSHEHSWPRSLASVPSTAFRF